MIYLLCFKNRVSDFIENFLSLFQTVTSSNFATDFLLSVPEKLCEYFDLLFEIAVWCFCVLEIVYYIIHRMDRKLLFSKTFIYKFIFTFEGNDKLSAGIGTQTKYMRNECMAALQLSEHIFRAINCCVCYGNKQRGIESRSNVILLPVVANIRNSANLTEEWNFINKMFWTKMCEELKEKSVQLKIFVVVNHFFFWKQFIVISIAPIDAHPIADFNFLQIERPS